MLVFILNIAFVSTSYSQESNEDISDLSETYFNEEIKKYKLGIEASAEMFGIGPVIELFPQKNGVFGLAIGTNVACITGAVRFRVYSKVDKTSPFFGLGYGGWYFIPEKGSFNHWIFCNIGIRFILKSKSAISLHIGGIYLLNDTFLDHQAGPGWGVEYLWK
ncbi:MAG: hypothetical protein JSU92_04880 [Deltaproteobacteria bacterium]|nr:MAG: hypothetical protein JSU92_04880 [Deltaproteobacteria bacterium]